MYSCERVSELTSTAHDRKLRATERIGLWIHRALCPPCRAYRRQMNKLRERLHELDDTPPRETKTLDTSAKERIRERLAARRSPE